MVDSVINRSKHVLLDLLERQECCDIFFYLKDQVVIKGHSHILSAYTSKFSCEFHDYPLMFDMDTRIDQCTMWNVLRYMYIRDDFEISIENLDSFVLLAYFFLDTSLMANADNLLFKTISVSTAFETFHYAINMSMSHSLKGRIYEYINGNLFKWPENYTLDAILMYPHILTTVQNENFVHMNNMSQAAALVPMIANTPVVEISGSSIGEPSMTVDDNAGLIPKQDEIIEKPLEPVGNTKQGDLYDEIEEQLDVVGGSDFDPLFEQIELRLQSVGNQGHEALYAQIEGLLDVVGVFENEAAAMRSNMNEILYGSTGPYNGFNY